MRCLENQNNGIDHASGSTGGIFRGMSEESGQYINNHHVSPEPSRRTRRQY